MSAVNAPTMDLTGTGTGAGPGSHTGDDAVGFLGASSGQPVVIPRCNVGAPRAMGTAVDNQWTAIRPVSSGHRYLSTIHRPYHHYQSIHQNREQGNRSL